MSGSFYIQFFHTDPRQNTTIKSSAYLPKSLNPSVCRSSIGVVVSVEPMFKVANTQIRHPKAKIDKIHMLKNVWTVSGMLVVGLGDLLGRFGRHVCSLI